MASMNKLTTPPPDELLRVREKADGTLTNADAIVWLDLGAGYPMGDLASTRQIPAQRCVFVVDFTSTASPTSSDTITVNLYLDATGDKSGAVTQVLQTFDDGDDPVAKRYVYEVDNEFGGTFYRYMGFEVSADSADADAVFDAFVVPAGSAGIS